MSASNTASPAKSAARLPGSAERLLRDGFARQQAGDLTAAETCYRAALDTAPKDHRGLTLLASLLETRGEDGPAEALYRQALDLAPKAPAPRLQLAALRLRLGDAGSAHGLIRPFTKGRPTDANGWRIRARAAQAINDVQDAKASYQAAIKAGDLTAAAPLGQLLQKAFDWAGAAKAYERALPLDPENASLHGALGKVYAKLGRKQAAMERYQRATELDPTLASAHAALGLELQLAGRFDEAAAAYQRALAITPGEADYLNNLANVRLGQGLPRQAQAIYRQLIDINPDYPAAQRNLCMATAYDDDATSDDLADVCRGAVAAFAVAPPPPLPATDGRPLRVGFVSADLRAHSVAAFVEPLFAHFNPDEIECHAYALTDAPDRVTARLRAMATSWRDAAGWTPDAMAAAIRADGIDILIDLAGHTGDARLAAFASRPAPIQASWLGWPATTGFTAIDFKLSDALLTPPGAIEAFAEEPVNISGPALCFQPPDDASDVTPPPMLANGFPTFGSFNRIFKASPRTLRLWAATLARIPNARLLLKDKAFRCPQTTAQILQRMMAAGIDPTRVTTLGATPSRAAHLELYGRIDAALDSVPYNGVTTTSEALWMGVPTVTLVGDRSLARYGLTVLTHAGQADCIATTPADFVERAAALVADPAALAARRRAMRHRLAASPLLDGPAFASNFAAACRRMVEIIRLRAS